jgi:dihydroorotate dehydrogenase (fumarate)
MAVLSTKYLGFDLNSPLVVSSNPLCRELDNIKRMEDAGAGAIVLPSLFEEQVILQENASSSQQSKETILPPALQHLPDLEEYNSGADGYLMHIYEAKKAVDIPVIASLNGTSTGNWVSYARLLASAGADAMELNIYYLPTSIDTLGTEIEQRFVRLVHEIKANVPIPVAVKLGPQFSSIPNIAARLSNAGADALVMFNRFYQPDFDLDTETVVPSLNLSDSTELRLRLRWIAILYGQIQADMAITGGVHTGEDAVKALLAGASAVMMASALLKHGISHIEQVRTEMTQWLDAHGYASVADAKGRMSQQNTAAPAAFERANYIEELQSYSKKA